MKKSLFTNGFYLLTSLFVLGNLLIYNDWFTWFTGAEIALVQAAEIGDSGWLVPFLYHGVEQIAGSQSFWLRFISLAFFGGSLYIVYRMGSDLFGPRRQENTVLILAVSPLMLALGKVTTGDMVLFFFQTGILLSLLQYLKRGGSRWRALHLIFLLGALWANPWSTLVLVLVTDAVLLAFHPQGKRLVSLWHWIVFPFIFGGLWLIGGFPFPTEFFYLSYGEVGPLIWLAVHFVVLLPWWGFLVAAFRQVWINGRRGEEWSILTVAVLAGSLAAGSLVLQLALALLIARPLQDYIRPNYPYRGLVKGMALTALISAFCLGAIGMLNGFYYLQATGFRVMMAVCLGFWIPYFISVLGLFSLRRGQYRNMAALSVVFAFFFFLAQGGPVLEKLREWQRVVPQELGAAGVTELWLGESLAGVPAYYLEQNGIAARVGELTAIQVPLLIDSTQIMPPWSEELRIDTFPALGNQWYLIRAE